MEGMILKWGHGGGGGGDDTPLQTLICGKFDFFIKNPSQINITLRLTRLMIPLLGLISSYS